MECFTYAGRHSWNIFLQQNINAIFRNNGGVYLI